ncbi:MAG: hypothetical protein HYX48_00925 [Chlamydiales bacterium]|nr:hypothetical protein [Chlamydiales bacterium]
MSASGVRTADRPAELPNLLPRAYSVDDFVEDTAAFCFQLASYFTDPACRSHELYRRIDVVDALNPAADALVNLARKVVLFVGVLLCASLAVFTTLPGIGLRLFGSWIQKSPFIYVQGELDSKILPQDRIFSLLSWNICCVGGGYSISDGGVEHWSFRIDEIIDKIVARDADVNCLYETFDFSSATYITEKLKERGYNHFYFNIGPKAVGVSSGILIASKYRLSSPEFTQFPQETLVGRTKNAAKGVFSFDVESQGKSFAKIHATHLQHSEAPSFPTDEEVKGRLAQMLIVKAKAEAVRDRCVVATGDLNLNDEEYARSSWASDFVKPVRVSDKKTWGGDKFCAELMGKQVSGPLNLDHTIICDNEWAQDAARSGVLLFNASLVETGYDPEVFKKGVLSDHEGLFTTIRV